MPGITFPNVETVRQLKELNKFFRENMTFAVLWDVQNVNIGKNYEKIKKVVNYLSQFGRLSIAKAYADWSDSTLKEFSEHLSVHHFELIHVAKPKKNTADMIMITHGIEIALNNPSVGTFILISGDKDFRPLVLALRRNGKRIHLISISKNTDKDLIKLADSYTDISVILDS